MSKIKLDLEKKTLNFFRGDVERLASLYPNLEVSTVIRELVHQHVEKIENAVPTEAVRVDLQ